MPDSRYGQSGKNVIEQFELEAATDLIRHDAEPCSHEVRRDISDWAGEVA